MGMDFLCHFYKQKVSNLVNLEEKLKISYEFLKIEDEDEGRMLQLKEKTQNSREKP